MSETATKEPLAPTEQLPAVRPPRPPHPPRGLRELLLDPLIRPLASLRPYAGLIVVVGAIAAVVVVATSGGVGGLLGGARADLGPPPGIVAVGSSWVTGEPSLADSPQFAAIENRAVPLAESRWAARQALIAAIIAAKKAAALRKRQDLLKKYEELRAKELAAYHAKLLEIERERAAAERKLAAERKKYQEELAAYMRKRRVTPGQECRDPTVAQYYSCQNGLLPAGKKAPTAKPGH